MSQSVYPQLLNFGRHNFVREKLQRNIEEESEEQIQLTLLWRCQEMKENNYINNPIKAGSFVGYS